MLSECSINETIHNDAHKRLNKEINSMKTWRKDHYPKKMFGGLKDIDRLDKQFKQTTESIIQAMKNVEHAKEAQASADKALNDAQGRKDQDPENTEFIDDVELKTNQKSLADIELESAESCLEKHRPIYEQNYQKILQQIEEIEKKRLAFIKVDYIIQSIQSDTIIIQEITRKYIDAIDLTDTSELKSNKDAICKNIENFEIPETIFA